MVNLGKPYVVVFSVTILALFLFHWCAQVEYNNITEVPPPNCAIHCVEMKLLLKYCCCGVAQFSYLCAPDKQMCINRCNEHLKSCCVPKH
ncbi:hypothetical protein Hanom_Chr09g00762871 [Helianthus anomalus]